MRITRRKLFGLVAAAFAGAKAAPALDRPTPLPDGMSIYQLLDHQTRMEFYELSPWQRDFLDSLGRRTVRLTYR